MLMPLTQFLSFHFFNPSSHCGTPLHKASSNGHSEIVEILLQNGAEVNALNEFDFTPLHFAAQNGHFAIVETLLTHGAEKGLKSYFHTTPLELAKYFKRGDFQQIVAILD